MEPYEALLQELYDKVPRRHTAENVQAMNALLDDYADILGKIEAINPWYEKNTASLYPSLETIQQTIKGSKSNKHSKKVKDTMFDEASGQLKDDISSLIAIYDGGSKTA